MIRRTLCTFTLMLVLGVMAPSTLAQDIVPEGGKLTKLFEASVLTEGVAVAPDGMVYFSDITFSHLSGSTIQKQTQRSSFVLLAECRTESSSMHWVT